jgi:5-methylcytosine-specific restriction endonuclease McrA
MTSPAPTAGWVQRLRERRGAARAAKRNRARGTHCFYCTVPFGPEGDRARTVDHRVPRGGGGNEGLVNLVFACRACNERKADRPEDEFVASEWLAQRRRSIAEP